MTCLLNQRQRQTASSTGLPPDVVHRQVSVCSRTATCMLHSYVNDSVLRPYDRVLWRRQPLISINAGRGPGCVPSSVLRRQLRRANRAMTISLALQMPQCAATVIASDPDLPQSTDETRPPRWRITTCRQTMCRRRNIDFLREPYLCTVH